MRIPGLPIQYCTQFCRFQIPLSSVLAFCMLYPPLLHSHSCFFDAVPSVHYSAHLWYSLNRLWNVNEVLNLLWFSFSALNMVIQLCLFIPLSPKSDYSNRYSLCLQSVLLSLSLCGQLKSPCAMGHGSIGFKFKTNQLSWGRSF